MAAPLICSLLCSAQPATGSGKVRPVDVATALSWLPTDTETLVVADVRAGSFLNGRAMKTLQRRQHDESRNPVLTVQEIAALFESSPLSFMETTGGSLLTLLNRHHIVLAMEGSRHFRPPQGLGEMRFEGCEIVVFGDGLGSTQELLKRFKRGAARQEEIEGDTVNVFEEKMEEDTWTIYVAFPQPNILLMASNRDYLQQVLTRMNRSPSNRALPDSLPEWKHVNREAPFWGIRHYDRSQADLDPSSPFGGHKAANEPDDKAIGLVFNYDPTKGRLTTVTYVTGGQKNAGIVERAFRTRDKRYQEPAAEDLQATAREIEPGVLEFSFHLSKSDSVSYFFFVLEGVLGHATYL